MIVQFEDIIDVLRVLYQDKYDFIFYFDHSSGHDRLRPDGLNAKMMNKGYGGTQLNMRESTIKDETYLGLYSHPHKLHIGDTQHMQFQPNDYGPFYLTPEDRANRKFNVESSENEKKKHTKMQLIKMIDEKTNGLTKAKGSIKDIQSIAQRLNLPIEYERNKVSEGWNNKPKGMLQILWERGFINPEITKQQILKHYSVNGRKNKQDGNIIAGTSLKELISNLPDFKQEITLL